jgi:hypothetical protein
MNCKHLITLFKYSNICFLIEEYFNLWVCHNLLIQLEFIPLFFPTITTAAVIKLMLYIFNPNLTVFS